MVKDTESVYVRVNVMTIDVIVNYPTFCENQNVVKAFPIKIND